ncbi:hypothetical protein M0R45_010306 [Rubus argutus]|uniref:Uncharacterized protein n=1 Tax=Rubus argutus TaxID=59490 RepID=A0AAW1Y6Y8_RUBAR
MSELSFSSSNPKFSGLDIVADFFHVCFFILSHTLFTFLTSSSSHLTSSSFSLSLLCSSPLLCLYWLTSLFLPTPVLNCPKSSLEGNGSIGYFLEAASAILEEIRVSPVEELSSEKASDAPIDERSSLEGNGSTGYFEASSAVLVEAREYSAQKNCSSQVSDAPVDERLSLEGNGSASDFFEASTVRLYEKAVEEEKEVKPLSAYFDKVEDEKEKRSMRRESKDRDMGANDGGFRSKSMVINGLEDSQIFGPNLGSFGSMRKEKEWRRTLACKLFEERHQNVDEGGEGMDMLWETYDETESSKVVQGINKNKSKKQGKKINGNNEVVDDEEEDG